MKFSSMLIYTLSVLCIRTRYEQNLPKTRYKHCFNVKLTEVDGIGGTQTPFSVAWDKRPVTLYLLFPKKKSGINSFNAV